MRRRSIRSQLAKQCAAVLLLVLPCQTAAGQEFAWVGRIGTDTAVIELGQKSDQRISGTTINIAMGMLVQRYEADLNSSGNIIEFRLWNIGELDSTPSSDELPALTVTFSESGLAVSQRRGDSVTVTRVPANPKTVPVLDAFFNAPMALMAHAFEQASNELSLYYLGRPEASTTEIERNPTGELTIPYLLASDYPMLAGARLKAAIGPHGMEKFDARETTFKVVTTPGSYTEPMALARSLKARGLGSGGFSTLSPPTKLETTLSSIEIGVSYGQPSRRGRTIFPDVVAFDEVWRAGANSATRLTISEDLSIAGTVVPQGSYSLWVIPSAATDTLIINTADRVWGTNYDASNDLVRIPMHRRTLSAPVEKLTYSVRTSNGTSELVLAWGAREMSVTITGQ